MRRPQSSDRLPRSQNTQLPGGARHPPHAPLPRERLSPPAHCCRSSSTRRVAAYEKCCVCNAARLLAVPRPTCMILRIQKRVSGSVSFRLREHCPINRGQSLTASPARLRVSQGRTALRSVAHSAMRPHRGVAPGIPVCPPREHVPPRPLRRIALWSVLARGQNDPAASSVSRVRSVRLPARVGQTYRQNTHT